MNRRVAVLALALLSLAAPSFAEVPTGTATIEVKLRGITPGKGTVVVLLFDSAQGYDASKPIQSNKSDAGAASMQVTFTDLAPGRYAIKAFNDVNNNNVYDQGIDGLGFSNHVTMSDPSQVPTFSETSFLVKAGVNTQQITFAK